MGVLKKKSHDVISASWTTSYYSSVGKKARSVKDKCKITPHDIYIVNFVLLDALQWFWGFETDLRYPLFASLHIASDVSGG